MRECPFFPEQSSSEPQCTLGIIALGIFDSEKYYPLPLSRIACMTLFQTQQPEDFEP